MWDDACACVRLRAGSGSENQAQAWGLASMEAMATRAVVVCVDRSSIWLGALVQQGVRMQAGPALEF